MITECFEQLGCSGGKMELEGAAGISLNII